MLFSIGTLVPLPENARTTPTGIHLLMIALVVALVGTRLSNRIPSAIIVTVIAIGYVSSRALFEDATTVRSTASGFVMAIEVGFAALAALLAIRVSRGLNQFEASVANITLDETAGVMTLAAAREDIAIEMSRARRHERPLTVTVLSFDPRAVHASLHEIVRDVQQRMLQRYIMSGLARVAAQTTRRGDIVVQDPAANRVIVLSPESSPVQLDALTQRLQKSAYRSLGIPIRFGSAGFPNSALTFDDLVAHASGDADIEREIVVPEKRRRPRTAVNSEGAPVPSMRSLYRSVDDVPTAAPHLDEHAQAMHGD